VIYMCYLDKENDANMASFFFSLIIEDFTNNSGVVTFHSVSICFK
jgi:hypothetical protein